MTRWTMAVVWFAGLGTAEFVLAQGGLVAHYTFDEGSGTVVHDTSGNGNDGTLYGPGFDPSGLNYSLRFDGVDDYVDCGNGPSLDLNTAVTVRAWVYPEARPLAEPGIVVKQDLGAYGLTYYKDGRCWWYIGGGANNCKAGVGVGGWSQVTGTYDGSRMRLYVNGQLKDTRDLNIPIPSSGNLLLGRRYGLPYFFPGLIEEVQIYDRALSAAEIQSLYETEAQGLIVDRPPIVDGLELPGPGFVVRVGDRAGMEVQIGGDVYFVESSYSYPGTAIGRDYLSQGGFAGEPGWTPAVSQDGGSAIQVQAAGAFFSLSRRIELDGDRVRISDTLTNLTDQDVAIVLRNLLIGAGGIVGYDPEPGNSPPANPILLLSKDASSLGVLAEDDILRVQFESSVSVNQGYFGTGHFALPPGQSHTFRWVLYPQSLSRDYYGFIKRLRRDLNSNFAIQGPFMFFPANSPLLADPEGALRDYLSRKKIKIAAMSPWLDYDPGPMDHVLTREEYKALMQPAIAALKQADPDILCIGSIETDWVAIDPDQIPGGDQLPQWQGGASGSVELDDAQTAIIDNANLPWADSYKRLANGHLTLELYGRGGQPQTSIWVYPEIGNYQYAFLMDQVQFLLNEVGMDGFYIDEFSQAWYGPQRTYNTRYDGTTWDGVSVDVNHSTGQIISKYVDCSLTAIQGRVNLCQYALDRGKVVVANTYATSTVEQALPVNRFAETWGHFDPMQWPDGTEPPLIPYLLTSHLGSPIGLGIDYDRDTVDYGRRLMKAVVTYLRHSMVYYHYVIPDPPETGPGSGEFGPINHMFPITPVDLGEGFIAGQQRILSAVSGTFNWLRPDRPKILLFDLDGRPVEHSMVPTPSGGGWQADLQIADWAQIAVVEPHDGTTESLRVRSTPVDGVQIDGTQPGTTDYAADPLEQTQVNLTAPPWAWDGQLGRAFRRWDLVDELMAHYPIDQGTGTTAYDVSGYDNDGTVDGAAWVPISDGYALWFDGLDDGVDCGDGPSLDITGPVTVGAWINPDQIPAGEVGVAGKDLSRFLMTYYADGRCYFYIGAGGNDARAAVPAATWSHVVGTFDGATIRFYRNGALIDEQASTYSTMPAGGNFRIGRRSSGGHFPGMIADVKVYARALSAAEVQAEYNSGPWTYAGTPQPDGQRTISFVINRPATAVAVYDDAGQNFHAADMPAYCDCGACGDWRIELCEMVGYAAAWKRGDHDDLAAMVRAAFLWKSGELYHWDGDEQQWYPGRELCTNGVDDDDDGLIDCEQASCVDYHPSCTGGGDGGAKALPVGRALRRVDRGADNNSLRVTITAVAPTAVLAVGLEDAPPHGSVISQVSDGGQWDARHGKVKWGPWFHDLSRTVSYLVTTAPDSETDGGFSGIVSFDGRNRAIEAEGAGEVTTDDRPAAADGDPSPPNLCGVGVMQAGALMALAALALHHRRGPRRLNQRINRISPTLGMIRRNNSRSGAGSRRAADRPFDPKMR